MEVWQSPLVGANQQSGWQLVGKHLFSFFFDFYWSDHRWSRTIPEQATINEYMRIVFKDHPQLLQGGIGDKPES